MQSYQAPMTGGEKHISGMEVFRQQMFHKVFPPHALFLLKRSRGEHLLDGSPWPGSVYQAWGGTKCYLLSCVLLQSAWVRGYIRPVNAPLPCSALAIVLRIPPPF